jgi:hypothetical protein
MQKIMKKNTSISRKLYPNGRVINSDFYVRLYRAVSIRSTCGGEPFLGIYNFDCLERDYIKNIIYEAQLEIK